MKSKTINSILRKKFDAFCDSIDDPAVKALVEKNTIITGGAIVSLLLNQNVNDYDLYFRTQETAFAVAGYYCKKYQATNPEWEVKATLSESGRVSISVFGSKNVSVTGEAPESSETIPPGLEESEAAFSDADELPAAALKEEQDKAARYQPLFLSSNAITLSTKVQIVIRFYGEPDQIHENYDFVHCTSYWTSWSNGVVLRPEALEAILTKELRYVGSKYPICSLIRTRKFLSRGWTINAGQFVKMAWQISDLDLQNIEVLKDQLVGVDSTYFLALISALKSKMDKEDHAHVDGSYLMTLIDKIF